ncbi:MAG: flippase-like domain-containing protein [Polyangiaceae bacterium]|jgi:hypothetical protein|nr:flippase-like domain-containing protein [Polyangiaceae bacterium]
MERERQAPEAPPEAPPRPNAPEEAASPTTPNQPRWRRLLPWVLGALLLGFVLSKTDLGAVAASLRAVNLPAYLALVVAFGLLNLACDAFAASEVFRRSVARVRFRTIAVVRAASYLPQLLNFHVGQAYTAYLLTRVYGAPLGRVVGAMLLVYATTFGALAAVPALTLPAASKALPWLTRPVAALTLLGVVYLVVLALKPRFLCRRPALAALFEVGPWGHLYLLLCRLPHVATLCAGTWLSFYFFHITIPPFESLLYVPAILFVTIMPLTPQGVGTRELLAFKLLLPFAPAAADPKALIVASGLAWATSTALMAALISVFFAPAAARLFRAGAAGAADRP